MRAAEQARIVRELVVRTRRVLHVDLKDGQRRRGRIRDVKNRARPRIRVRDGQRRRFEVQRRQRLAVRVRQRVLRGTHLQCTLGHLIAEVGSVQRSVSRRHHATNRLEHGRNALVVQVRGALRGATARLGDKLTRAGTHAERRSHEQGGGSSREGPSFHHCPS